MTPRFAGIMLAFALAGCSTDIDTIGRAPGLSPVGSGIGGHDRSASLEAIGEESAGNSSWIGSSADYFRDNRAHRVGDLITVKIAVDEEATLNNTSNRSRKASSGADLGFTYDIMGVVKSDINGEGDINSRTSTSGQGSTERSERIDVSVAAIVTDVMPNGFLVVEGSQEMVVNYEQRVLTIAGIVRPVDITPDNTIAYDKIAEARISYGGRGRLSEVQQPGWGQQIWDRISPY